MKVLITGSSGYVGRHLVSHLIDIGMEVVCTDIRYSPNFNEDFFQWDLKYANHEHGYGSGIDAMVHLGGLISGAESHQKPDDYYEVNCNGTINALRFARRYGVKNFILASSAAVYSLNCVSPVQEHEAIGSDTETPYGSSKIFAERMMNDFGAVNGISTTALRFFNIVGCDPNVKVRKTECGLFSIVADVILGSRDKIDIYGRDYPTHDGTCIRDYIHVSDIVLGIEKVITSLTGEPKVLQYNLGTGNGVSVLEVIEVAKGLGLSEDKINFVSARSGEIFESVADISKLSEAYKWKPSKVDIKKSLMEELDARRIVQEHS